jgi:hypothetical protein
MRFLERRNTPPKTRSNIPNASAHRVSMVAPPDTRKRKAVVIEMAKKRLCVSFQAPCIHMPGRTNWNGFDVFRLAAFLQPTLEGQRY